MSIYNPNEKVCMFCGYADSSLLPPNSSENIFYEIEQLIQKEGVNCFLTGNIGAFDGMANTAVYTLKKCFSHVRLKLVLPYKIPNYFYINKDHSKIYDEIIFSANVLNSPETAIRCNNEFMVDNSDCLFTFLYQEDRFSSVYETFCYAQKLQRDIFYLTP